MLGAGSFFTAGLMRDVMLIPGLDRGEIRLVDIDRKRLDITLGVVKALAQKIHGDKWSVIASTDRRKVLKGSDYIINCIEVSGMQTVKHDNDIPFKYGVDQCIGDTIGPGGIFKGLRTIPSWLAILADIEKLCPNALVMNYTNPMSMMILAAVRATNVPVIGLCHSVQGSSEFMSRIGGVPHKELSFRCGGINHMAWFTELTHKGRDLYPRIFKTVRESKAKKKRTNADLYEMDPVRFELMLAFGAYVTESSGHNSEYHPYFRKRPDLLKLYCRDGYRGGSGFYSSCWPKWRKDSDKARLRLAKNIDEMGLTRGHEYASEIIEAHHFNKPAVIYGSVLNDGLIDNLPHDGVVEVATLVDNTGYNPCRFGPLPSQLAALCRGHMGVYECAVEGIINKDREAIYHAMMLDPLASAVCSHEEIKRMTDEMAIAEKDYIPGFMTKGLTLRKKRN